MIRHQTPSKNIDAEAVQFFGHKIEVGSSITVGVENRNGSHAPLRDMMWITRSYNPGNSRHAQTLVEPNIFSQDQISMVSPESLSAHFGYFDRGLGLSKMNIITAWGDHL